MHSWNIQKINKAISIKTVIIFESDLMVSKLKVQIKNIKHLLILNIKNQLNLNNLNLSLDAKISNIPKYSKISMIPMI